MAPISSLLYMNLFIVFSMSFMIFNMMNYYTFNPTSPKSKFLTNKMFNSLNWKW